MDEWVLTVASGGFFAKVSSCSFVARSSGFSPPLCYQCFIGPESLVIPVDLPPSVPFSATGSPFADWFLVLATAGYATRTVGLPGVRHIASSYPVRLQYASIHRILGLALSRLLVPLHAPIYPVRCSLRTRVLPHASFKHPITGNALALLALPFRPIR